MVGQIWGIPGIMKDDGWNEGESSTNLLALYANEDQQLTIQALFAHHDWDFTEVDIGTLHKSYEHLEAGASDDSNQNMLEPGYVIAMDPNSPNRPHCLCSPCITEITVAVQKTFMVAWNHSHSFRTK